MKTPPDPPTMTVHHGPRVPTAPRFSIVIPCFNVGNMARDAVESALEQTAADVEVIVVDDGSQSPVISELQPFLERIILVRQANGGLSHARNTGIRKARGDYIVLLDGDDALMPSHCQACLDLFQSDPSCLAAAPDAWIFGEGQPPGIKLSDLYPRLDPISLENFLSGTSPVPGCCTFRKEAYIGIPGPYDVTFSCAEDFLLNAQLLARGVKYRFLNEPTYRYRKRAGSLSFDNPIPLSRAVLRAIDKLAPECTAGSPARRSLEAARERYATELNFHLFREALLSKSYHDALGYARTVQVRHLQPVQRRWKFRAGRAMVSVLSRVLPRN